MNLTKALELDKVERFESEFNGEKFWFEAKASKLTPKFHQAIIDVSAQPMKLAEELAGVITAWNIFLHEDGDFPPTLENLSGTPEDFIFHLVNVIAESWTGKKQEPSNSQSGSAATAS